jgi:phage terminase large subunit-like protein
LQKRFHDDQKKTKLLCGGNRSGKSQGVAYHIVDKIIKNPRQKWWVAGETFQDSVNIQQQKIWQLIPKHLIKYGKFDVINGFVNRKLLLTNGSLIIFKSFDQHREAFQGDAVDGCWLDEEPDYDIYQECRMRLIDRNGEMVISMTSLKGITELLAELFEDHDVIESQFCQELSRELPRIAEKAGNRLYFLWTTENPYIPQDRVAYEAKLMTAQEKLARIYGIPMNLSGKIYSSFNRKIHVIDWEGVPEGSWNLWMVLDPHDRKPWAIGWYAIHQTGTVYQIDEYPNRDFNEMTGDDKTYGDYVDLIKQKEEGLKEIFGVGISKRILDPNFGNKTVQLAERQGGQSKTTPKKELEKRGLRFTDGIDALEAGHLKVREFLKWEEKDGEIIYQPRFFILSHCHNSITHLSRYSRKDIITSDGDVKDDVKPREKYKDFCDLARYLAMANPRYIIQTEFNPETKRVY